MTSNALMNNYGTRKITLTRGQGSWVWDDQGNRYLDAISGIAVCGLGHAHPEVTKAIAEQAATLTHCSNLYNIPNQEALAEQLRDLSGLEKMFFCNSGAEANETAIKLARMLGNKRGIDEPTIIVLENAFHGRTLATLTATGNRKVQAGFEPLVRGFVRAPYGDIEALKTIAKNNRKVVALLLEPIQGEGGIRVPEANYLTGLRQLCDEQDWLLMLDEIQTGNGRTGKYFNYQHAGILPDVLTTAKGLGNGMPIGVCLTGPKASELMQPGSHGSTFGGNPLACAAGLATVKVIQEQNLCQQAADMGNYLLQQLTERLGGLDDVIEVRGQGLMLGIEMKQPCTELVEKAAAKGLLINVTAQSVIRLLPPLNISQEEADQLVQTLGELLTQE
ncbi:acetylornithine transaminase [Porticoccus litoralis]|uniref:Acetylornithine aminotransferase n=1 Tax=Porticoccus litoralis TaxID=434086 RepID=A0AAW8B0H1_9GAMM|nr:acetylornithine transaminase [Porticoccus litoralis]MDP1519580.1 acetylornithine transaminase [Porticoccus litoralis]